ncbi:MAG: dihydrofolate reductase family protein [Planctomycetia bacterium]|nr:dihydrofolate reductase family protein [Planctomycetia bacterium]
MRKLIVFNSVSLDGYFTDSHSDMSWAHKQDPEWMAFVQENARRGGELVFGRKTYEMMASFWPTPQAIQTMPEVAKGMNESPKVVFSKSLERASWKNTRLFKGDPAGDVRKLKNESGPDMVIFGSGTIISQLAPHGLVDEYQFVVCPIVLGDGRTMFDGVPNKLNLKRASTRTFTNGNVLLTYQPAS